MLSKEDRVLIKILRIEKGYGARKLISEFSRKNWSLASVNRLLHKVDTIGSADRKPGSGRRRTARTDGNIHVVEDQNIIDTSVNQWRDRLRMCIHEKGGHFEHLI